MKRMLVIALSLILLLTGCAPVQEIPAPATAPAPTPGLPPGVYDMAEDGADLFRLYSAYPVEKGEASHSLMLSWERGGETVAAPME